MSPLAIAAADRCRRRSSIVPVPATTTTTTFSRSSSGKATAATATVTATAAPIIAFLVFVAGVSAAASSHQEATPSISTQQQQYEPQQQPDEDEEIIRSSSSSSSPPSILLHIGHSLFERILVVGKGILTLRTNLFESNNSTNHNNSTLFQTMSSIMGTAVFAVLLFLLLIATVTTTTRLWFGGTAAATKRSSSGTGTVHALKGLVNFISGGRGFQQRRGGGTVTDGSRDSTDRKRRRRRGQRNPGSGEDTRNSHANTGTSSTLRRWLTSPSLRDGGGNVEGIQDGDGGSSSSSSNPSTKERRHQLREIDSRSGGGQSSNSDTDDDDDQNNKTSPIPYLLDKNIRETIQWWDDLAPPFNFVDEEDSDADLDLLDDEGDDEDVDIDDPDVLAKQRREEEEEEIAFNEFMASLDAAATTTSTANAGSLASRQEQYRQLKESSAAGATAASRSKVPMNITTRIIPSFCFLVHGHRGYARDLAYLEHKMERLAIKEKRKRRQKLQQQMQQALQKLDEQQQQQKEQEQEQQSQTASAAVDDDGMDRTSTTLTKDPKDASALSSETEIIGVDTAATTTETVAATAAAVAPQPQLQVPAVLPQTIVLHDIIVHAAVCNEKKTTDGVRQGGERLVDEMITVIRQEMEKRNRNRASSRLRRRRSSGKVAADQRQQEKDDEDYEDITVSVLGNSLGGLYGRYAIAKLAERCRISSISSSGSISRKHPKDTNNDDECESQSFILDGKYRIHFNVFCTTASPHLGVAGHTFLPLPRTAEIGVAVAMGDTGRDLFRLNDLLKEMATASEYLQPLSQFKKRIAYANAYGTDFPVPTKTAAFLSEGSEYPHHFYAEDTGPDNEDNQNRVVVDDNGLVIATLHTPPNHSLMKKNSKKIQSASSSSTSAAESDVDEEDGDRTDTLYVDKNDTDDLVQMSTSLDSLGWKKVFVDIRKEIPRIPLPTSLLRRTGALGGDNSSKSENAEGLGITGGTVPGDAAGAETIEVTKTEQQQDLAPIHKLKEMKVVGSRDVAAAVTKPLFSEDEFHWPMGHNMIVAFSRSRLSTYMNKAGRPVVDALAKELVEDIFAWTPPQTRKE